jgi:transcriptional regulator with XRE-family HTH domain
MRVTDPDRIRRERLRLNLSQRQLAALCNKTQNAISLIETGEMTTISEKFAMKLAFRLHLPWQDVFEAPPASLVSGDASCLDATCEDGAA